MGSPEFLKRRMYLFGRKAAACPAIANRAFATIISKCRRSNGGRELFLAGNFSPPPSQQPAFDLVAEKH